MCNPYPVQDADPGADGLENDLCEALNKNDVAAAELVMDRGATPFGTHDTWTYANSLEMYEMLERRHPGAFANVEARMPTDANIGVYADSFNRMYVGSARIYDACAITKSPLRHNFRLEHHNIVRYLLRIGVRDDTSISGQNSLIHVILQQLALIQHRRVGYSKGSLRASVRKRSESYLRRGHTWLAMHLDPDYAFDTTMVAWDELFATALEYVATCPRGSRATITLRTAKYTWLTQDVHTAAENLCLSQHVISSLRDATHSATNTPVKRPGGKRDPSSVAAECAAV